MKVKFINNLEFDAVLYDGGNGKDVTELAKKATKQKENLELQPGDLIVKAFDQILVFEYQPEHYDFEDFIQIIE